MEFATESAMVEQHLVPQVLDVSEERDEVNKAAVVYVKQLQQVWKIFSLNLFEIDIFDM